MTDSPSPLDGPLPSPPSPAGQAFPRDWFVDSSTRIVRWALLLGALRAVERLSVIAAVGVDGPPALIGLVAGAAAEVVAFGLGGLVVAALVRALGAWAESRSRADRGAYLPAELLLRAISSPPPAPDIPSPLVPAGAAQERTGEEDRVATSATRLAEVRRLIREGAWDEAREGVRAFRSASPDDPRGAEVSEELEGAKRAALERLEAELKAARGVNDPEQVMEIHSRMQVLVDGGTGDDLDVELAGWLLLVVHRRLRGGRIQPDVVSLAERVAERFGHTKEGASLRASLPTLRRSAGLCPRCGKPFTGAAEACPECLGASPPPASLVASEEDDEFAVERREPDWYSEPSDETAA